MLQSKTIPASSRQLPRNPLGARRVEPRLAGPSYLSARRVATRLYAAGYSGQALRDAVAEVLSKRGYTPGVTWLGWTEEALVARFGGRVTRQLLAGVEPRLILIEPTGDGVRPPGIFPDTDRLIWAATLPPKTRR